MTNHMNAPADGAHAGHGANDSAAGMAGLVLGIQVTGTSTIPPSDGRAPRRFSLVMREEPNRYGNQSGYRMDLEGAEAPRLNPGPVPGPVIVLTRGEPVEITLINRMTEPTAIHWHGIELDSYFDGVPGWGGQPGNIAPPVAPGQSFVAKFTPPRAGTFIYHTHWHKDEQLGGGLYGPLIVLEPGERYDPADRSHRRHRPERRPAGERAGAVRVERQRRRRPPSSCARACPIACASSTSPRATTA